MSSKLLPVTQESELPGQGSAVCRLLSTQLPFRNGEWGGGGDGANSKLFASIWVLNLTMPGSVRKGAR